MTLVIIPARYGSNRLPGKPLEKIGRKTVIEHCVDRAKEADLQPYVATDDKRIADLFPGMAVMTQDWPCGTDRVAEAAEIIDPEGKHEFVVNYQGDMPFLEAEFLRYFVRQREISLLDFVSAYSPGEFVSTAFERGSADLHIGLYGFTRKALRYFHSLPQNEEERRMRLEQCRVSHKQWMFLRSEYHPFEINTRHDLAFARQIARCTS